MKPIHAMGLFIAGLLAVLLLLPTPAIKTDNVRGDATANISAIVVAIVNARLFDGDELIENATILIEHGRVIAAGADVELPEGIVPVDAAGKTILPGLIDAHVHSFGTARVDALRFGVTTVLDMFRPPMDFGQIHAERELLAPTDRADLYSAGFLATAPGGHGTQYGIEVPTLIGPDQAAEWVAARKAEGSDWIKIVIEPGWVGRDLPTLESATVAALVEAAHASDLIAVAHVSSYADAMMAIEAGIDGLVHLFSDRPADQAFVASARQAGIFVVPTTPVLAAMHDLHGTDWLIEHPVLGPRLERSQIQGLRQRFPVAPDPAAWMNVEASIQALHAAGIPILAGSDAPNPGTTYGASIHRALRLLVGAGLSPHDALTAATVAPARAFGIEDRGCLKTSCRADLLIVQGDPSTDIEATANIEAVWKNGIPVEFDTAIATVTEDRVQSVAGEPLDLLAAPDRWIASADSFMGGSSNAVLEWDEIGAAVVTGQLAAGYPFPYAGAMWFASRTPMQPIDYSGYRRLFIEFQAEDGEHSVMFFSGESQAAPPAQVPIQPGREVTIELGSVGGLDPERLRAIGVFAGGQARPVDFTIRKARLE